MGFTEMFVLMMTVLRVISVPLRFSSLYQFFFAIYSE